MFTGIVEAIGAIATISKRGSEIRLTVAAGALELDDVSLGASIAVNGVCLTVVELRDDHFCVDVSKETLDCSVGLDAPGEVNLEKALRLSDRLGGHLLSGHVDGVAEIIRCEPAGESRLLWVRPPAALARYVARKGSVGLDGVSLTVNEVSTDAFCVNLIPHTLAVTTLKRLAAGALVNIEVDLIARYLERLAVAGQASGTK